MRPTRRHARLYRAGRRWLLRRRAYLIVDVPARMHVDMKGIDPPFLSVNRQSRMEAHVEHVGGNSVLLHP